MVTETERRRRGGETGRFEIQLGAGLPHALRVAAAEANLTVGELLRAAALHEVSERLGDERVARYLAED